MFLDAGANALEVLAQPVVAKADAGVGAGLRLSGLDQRGERFDLVDEACEGFALGVGVGENWRCREECRQNDDGCAPDGFALEIRVDRAWVHGLRRRIVVDAKLNLIPVRFLDCGLRYPASQFRA